MVEAKEEEEDNQVTVLNTTVIKIYELLDDVVHGNETFKVKVEGYGLTKAGSASNALGGVNSLLDNAGTGANVSYSGSGGTGGTGGVNSISGSVDFGGWTAMA